MRRVLVVVFVVMAGVLFADEFSDLIDRLRADDWKTRQEAKRILKERAMEFAERLIETARSEKDPEVREALGEILGTIKYPSPEAIQEAEKIIKEWIKLRADEEKAKKEGAKLIERLKKLRHIEHWFVHRLPKIKEKETAKAMAELLWGLFGDDFSDGNVIVRGAGPGAVRVKVVVIKANGKKQVKIWKDGKLVTQGGKPNLKATPLTALIKSLYSTNDPLLAQRILKALAELGDPHAVGAIAPLLKSKNATEDTISAAIEALKRLTGVVFTEKKDLEEQRKAWQQWWEKNKQNPNYAPPKLPQSAENSDDDKDIPPMDKFQKKMIEEMMKRMMEEMRKLEELFKKDGFKGLQELKKQFEELQKRLEKMRQKTEKEEQKRREKKEEEEEGEF